MSPGLRQLSPFYLAPPHPRSPLLSLPLPSPLFLVSTRLLSIQLFTPQHFRYEGVKVRIEDKLEAIRDRLESKFESVNFISNLKYRTQIIQRKARSAVEGVRTKAKEGLMRAGGAIDGATTIARREIESRLVTFRKRAGFVVLLGASTLHTNRRRYASSLSPLLSSPLSPSLLSSPLSSLPLSPPLSSLPFPSYRTNGLPY